MPDRELTLQKKLIFSAIVLLFFGVMGELLVRGWVYYLREDYTRYETTTGMPYLVPGIHGRGEDPIVINEDGFVGAELRAPSPNLFRIVTLGDSNTFGGGSAIYAYPAVMGQIVEQRPDGERFEVVNAGIEGMDSHQALYRLRNDVLPLEPDVVTLYIGWNDLMKYDPLGQSDASGVVAATSRFVDRLWTVKAIRKALFFYLRPRMDPPPVGPESHSGRFVDFVPNAYIDNVDTIVREIRAAGAKPVLMSLTTVVRPDFTHQDLVEQNVYMPYYPSGYALLDFLDLVASYNRAVEGIAARHDVPVVELAAFFGARPDYKALFYDTMHPNDVGYRLLAENVMGVLDAEGLLPPLREGRTND